MHGTTGSTRTTDGVDIALDILHPDADASAAIVLVHGFTAHRRQQDVTRIATALQAAGYVVVVGDLRGHGESGGQCTLGDDERLDVEAMVVAARQEHQRVVLVGASMGAIAALRHAAADPAIDGVVVVSCPARWQLVSVRSAIAALFTQTGFGRTMLRRQAGVRVAALRPRPAEPEAVSAKVTAPLAIVHGLADRFMPALEASRLDARAGGPHRLDLVPAMGHAFHERGTSAIVAAVAWCLTARAS